MLFWFCACFGKKRCVVSGLTGASTTFSRAWFSGEDIGSAASAELACGALTVTVVVVTFIGWIAPPSVTAWVCWPGEDSGMDAEGSTVVPASKTEVDGPENEMGRLAITSRSGRWRCRRVDLEMMRVSHEIHITPQPLSQ